MRRAAQPSADRRESRARARACDPRNFEWWTAAAPAWLPRAPIGPASPPQLRAGWTDIQSATAATAATATVAGAAGEAQAAGRMLAWPGPEYCRHRASVRRLRERPADGGCPARRALLAREPHPLHPVWIR